MALAVSATVAGGSGGSGGVGTFLGSGATLSNSGIVTGGAGGAGGGDAGAGGTGGLGGAGVVGSGLTITNTGTISGGSGGAAGTGASPASPGAGGAGILGANLTVINSGAITGGLSGDGVTRANAITFTGGTNVLELQPGSAITGNVVAFSATDTLRLGGSGAASFDVSQIGLAAQYQGFGIFQKTGSSTWTLTGSNATVTPWVIQAGTLAVAADANLGAATGGLAFGGGTLQFLSGFATNRAVALNAGGGTFDTNGFFPTLSRRSAVREA